MPKNKKKVAIILTLFLSVICIIGFISNQYGVKNFITEVSARYKTANASTTEDGRFEYTVLTDGTIEISKYVGKDTEVTIPSTIDGKTITRIKAYAFLNCSSLTRIEIPSGVTSIGNYAFLYCKSLISIEISSSVTSIGGSAFSGCSSLTTIDVNENNQNYCSKDGILFNNVKTKIIRYPSGKKESTYKIPEGVTSIAVSAFSGCSSLISIEISSSVTSIGGSAFSDCSSLSAINVNKNNYNYCSEDGILFNNSKTKMIMYPLGKKERTYKIPEGVTSIEASAFEDCSSLENIEIPYTVTSIGDSAFKGCKSLIEIKIPNGVRSIELYTFEDCSSLRSIEIQSGVTSIGNAAFSGCSSLEGIKIPNSVTIIEPNAFINCSSLRSVEISDSVTSIGNCAFSNCSSLISIEIPSGVMSIGDNVFYNCSNLISINLPKELISIGQDAFKGCSKLENINVATENEKYKSIEGVLFNKEVTEILIYPAGKSDTYKIPEGVKNIANYAFADNIKYLEIPEGVNSIGELDFYHAKNLQKIRIPSSVKEIQEKALGYHTSKYLIIYCENDSYAEQYAKSEEIIYKNWNEYTTEVKIKSIQFEDVNLYNKIINGAISYLKNGQTINMAESILNKNDESLTIQMDDIYIEFINSINISKAEIVSLKGIENFQNLNRIWARENSITDLSPIANLTKLTTIDFEDNQISDVSALQNLVKLEDINLFGNMRIKNIEPLQNLKNLKMLDLTASLVEDISPITNLTNLTELYLGVNSIKSIENIGNLTNLTTLVLANNEIEDISEISKLNKLEELYLGVKMITPHYIINEVENHIIGNKIKDISPLSNLNNLKTLGIEWNQISDISSIRKLNLSSLYAQNQQLNIDTTVKEDDSIEIELPEVFIEAKDETSIAYTAQGFKLQNCNLNDAMTKIIIGSNSIGKEVYVQIKGGVLDGTKLNINLVKTTTSEKYEITEEYITKISHKTTLKDFKESLAITNVTEVKVLNKNNAEITSEDIVATGMTLVLKSDTETKTLKLVVTGDVTGDGIADFKDIVAINRHRLNKKLLEGEYLMAGDVTADGVSDFKDIVKINRFRLNKITQLF